MHPLEPRSASRQHGRLPRPPPRLLTDDGLRGVGVEGSKQPEARRPAQEQAQHTQQAARARHGASFLLLPFKGTAGGYRTAAATGRSGAPGRGGAPPRGPLGNKVHARTRATQRSAAGRLPGRLGGCRHVAQPGSAARGSATDTPPRRLLSSLWKRLRRRGGVSASPDLPLLLLHRCDLGSAVTRLRRPSPRRGAWGPGLTAGRRPRTLRRLRAAPARGRGSAWASGRPLGARTGSGLICAARWPSPGSRHLEETSPGRGG